MSEYIDVDIIENGKVIGTMKVLKKTEEPEELNNVDDKTAYQNLLIEYAELVKENAELKRIVKMVAMINTGIYTNEGIKVIYEEAEQFLKEIE